MASFHLAVPGEQNDAVDLVFRPEVLDKRLPFMPRLVHEVEDRGESAVNKKQSLEPGPNRRQRLFRDLPRLHRTLAAGDLHAPPGHRPFQSFARPLADL